MLPLFFLVLSSCFAYDDHVALAVGVRGDVWQIKLPDIPNGLQALVANKIYPPVMGKDSLVNAVTGAKIGDTFYVVGQSTTDGNYQESIQALNLKTLRSVITPLFFQGSKNTTIDYIFKDYQSDRLLYLAAAPGMSYITLGELIDYSTPSTLFTFPGPFRSINGPSYDSKTGILYFQTTVGRGGPLLMIINATAALSNRPPHEIFTEDIPIVGIQILRNSILFNNSLLTCVVPDELPSGKVGLGFIPVSDNTAPVEIFQGFGTMFPLPCSGGVGFLGLYLDNLVLPSCCVHVACDESWYFYSLPRGFFHMELKPGNGNWSSPLCERFFAIYKNN